MAEPSTPEETEETQAQKPKKPARRRSGWRVAFRVAEIAFLAAMLPVVVLVIALLLATDNHLRLPEPAEARITAILDTAMSTYDVNVEEIGIALPEGRFTPEVVLSGVAIGDEDGLRAYFPQIAIVFNGQAMLQGELRPRRVQLDGAGLRLSRDENGVIDLALATGAPESALGITESLARMDRMFESPSFSELEEIAGSELVVLLSDEITGQLIQSQDAEMVLEQKAEALTLRVTGSIAASLNSSIELAVTRNPALGRNDILFAFENLDAGDLASASPALRWLDLVDGPITGRLVGQVSDSGRIGDTQGTLEIAAGVIRPRGGADPIPFERVAANLAFDADTGRIEFEEFSIASEALSFTAEGQADVFEEGRILVGQLRFSDMEAAPEGLFAEPLVFEGGALDMRLSLNPALDLQIGQAVLFDGPLRIQAWGSVEATEEGLVTRIDARIPQLEATELFPYWPEFIIPGTRNWITQNLTDGEIWGFAASIRRGPGGPQTGIRFDFNGLTLQPLDGMPPITGGSGYVSALDEQFALRLTGGEVEAPGGGLLDIAGSTMVIADTGPRNPQARFDLSVDGPLEAVGAILALPPVNLLAGSSLDPATIATGHADARASLEMTFRRVIPREEISFSAAGTLSDVRSENLITGRVLTADTLDLTVTPESVALAGRARIDGVGLTGRWSQIFGEATGSRAEGRLTVNRDSLAAFGVRLPQGMLSGSGGADFALDIPAGAPPELALSSDLAGIGLTIPGLPWRLSQSGTGEFATSVVLGEVPQIPSLSIDAAGLTLDASLQLGAEGAFQAMAINSGRIGNWANVTGRLTPQRLALTGGSVDLRRLTGGASGGGGLSIDANLDRLVLAEGIALTGLDADLGANLSGSFRGQVNGGAAIAGELTRNSNGLAINVVAQDAGAVLRSAGVFENGYGGNLALALLPTGSAGSYNGTLEVNGARLRNAPAMAELLNAISVVGLLEQLGGEGINLGDLDASFRIVPGAIILDEGSAIGPSMGISMDGFYESASGRYDMQGVISPLYLVNGIAGALFAPRREGLFGFTYRLTGNGDGANVSVNPLSILTPGIFREIFRRPPPEIATE